MIPPQLLRLFPEEEEPLPIKLPNPPASPPSPLRGLLPPLPDDEVGVVPIPPLPDEAGREGVSRRTGFPAWLVALLLLRRRRCALTSGMLSDMGTFHSLINYWTIECRILAQILVDFALVGVWQYKEFAILRKPLSFWLPYPDQFSP